MNRIVIFADQTRERVARAVSDFRKWLGDRCDVVSVALDEPPGEVDFDHVDLAVVFGGDGSFLAAARRLGGAKVPVVGVNMGKLGFLAELSKDELCERFDDICCGKLKPVERLMLEARIEHRDKTDGPYLALNDVVFRHFLPTRMLSFSLSVNGEKAIDYSGDGLIVSTPVGSTAYALSAGGPILVPGVQGLIATPICSHALANRPLVLTSKCELKLNLTESKQEAQLTIDGHDTFKIAPDDTVTVRAAPHPLFLIETGKRTFFQTLR